MQVFIDNTGLNCQHFERERRYFVGLPAEYPFSDNLIASLRVEYADYGSEEIDLGGVVGDIETARTGIKFGLAYHF